MRKPMTVARRLTLAFGLLVLMLALVAGIAGWALHRSSASLKTVYEDRTVPLAQLAQMQAVVADVQRVCDLIGEIGAAAGEQSQGIGQVGEALSLLDQTTQQNAALVEESAAAAESLKGQAARLAETVSAFRLQPAAA